MTRVLSFVIRGLASVAILALLVLVFAYAAFTRRVRREAEVMLAEAHDPVGGVVTEAMLEGLPLPVRRYLTYAGVVGKPVPRTVRLEQVGTIRRSATDPPRPLEAVQYYSIEPPGFIWIATMRQNGVPVVRGRDRYAGGRGVMQIKLGALVDLVNARGEALDQGALMRYLSEMIWFPAAFLGPNVRFEPIDDHSARVTLTDRGRSVTGTLHIDDEGRLTNFSAQRYMLRDGSSTSSTSIWSSRNSNTTSSGCTSRRLYW